MTIPSSFDLLSRRHGRSGRLAARVVALAFACSLALRAGPAVGEAGSAANPETAAGFDVRAEAALAAMEKEARASKATGVAVVIFSPGDDFTALRSVARKLGRAVDEPKNSEPGANLLAIAYAKATEMLVTHRPSGNASRKPYLGEVGWTGGDLRRTPAGWWAIAFSGAPSEVDLAISQAGLAAAGQNEIQGSTR